MPDKTKTEEIAVIAVKDAFAQVEGVLDRIKTEDKTPYVDGYLAVYKGDTDHKENLAGNIDVQVKGRNAKQIKSDKPKLQISVSDLKKYQTVFRGVMFFLVSVGADLKPKGIYYRQLLPYDIAEILQDVEDVQEKVSVRFNPLPKDDPFFLKKLCVEFLDNKDKQYDIRCIRIGGGREDTDRLVEFHHYELGKKILDTDDLVSRRAWVGETYEYGVTEDGQYYTLDKIEDVMEVGATREAEISSGGYTCSVMATLGEDEDGHYFRFGSFEFRFDPGSHVNYSPRGTFAERLRDARLMRGILNTEKLAVNHEELFRGVEFEESPIDDIDSNIKQLEHFERLAQKMHFQIDWDPAKLTEYELSELNRLTESIVYSKSVPLNGIDDDPVNLNMEIQGSRIKVIATKTDAGLYNLIDPLHGNIVAYVPGTEGEDDRGPEEGVPGFFLFNREDLRMAANLDSDDLESSFKMLPATEGKAPFLNYKLLEMLAAYDEGAVCEKQLLDCTNLVANQLIGVDPDSEIYFINWAQVQKRIGDLSESTKVSLRKVALGSEDEMVKLCAFSLLGEQEFANEVFSGLSERKREEFLAWPVSKYFR